MAILIFSPISYINSLPISFSPLLYVLVLLFISLIYIYVDERRVNKYEI